MDTFYNHKIIEKQAQKYWKENKTFIVSENNKKKKFYCLSMFPYPSGILHIGHVRNYTIGDVIARYHRSLGKNVLHPIGWDSFGLPAENAAINNNIHPLLWTKKNIIVMKKQLIKLGNSYDWNREISTCNPKYYKWEQWFFIQLYKKGLIYKKKSLVNWDPIDKTVLANEQVINGKGWRSGVNIEKKNIYQWFIKINKYAEELLKTLDTLEKWPKKVKQMQKNWIGKYKLYEIYFEIKDFHFCKYLKFYMFRIDTIMGITYLLLNIHHPIVKKISKFNPKVLDFIQKQKDKAYIYNKKNNLEYGIFTNIFAYHPITKQEIPIWITVYDIDCIYNSEIKSKASVPAHDKRDWDFAQQNKIPMKIVISSNFHNYMKLPNTIQEGILINSEQFNNLSTNIAYNKILNFLENKNVCRILIKYKLKDWCISRQRYWGTPIPMIYCKVCGIIPVLEKDLPITLPMNVKFTGNSSPLKRCKKFLYTTCHICGNCAIRETDTFDTFIESSWYYLYFTYFNKKNTVHKQKSIKYWMPVDQYIGGIEHSTMHLLYARFFYKLMRDENIVCDDEPFVSLLTQGTILKDNNKMSKSIGNVINPNYIIDLYGADTLRLFIMFLSPPDHSVEWSDSSINGVYRFLKKVWSFLYKHKELCISINNDYLICNSNNSAYNHELKIIKNNMYNIMIKINNDYMFNKFNTIVSGCMKILNELYKYNIKNIQDKYFIHFSITILLKTLEPIAPHICHVLWKNLGFYGDIIQSPWISMNSDILKLNKKLFMLRINNSFYSYFFTHDKYDVKSLLNISKKMVSCVLQEKNIKYIFINNSKKLIQIITFL